ncbi:hypothetical protein [Kitasatospora sp. NBC_01302]|uniref:hypothetical protein n=1 Tax=Kitasatospora sp. NBC_01302 TaxID=2903575 RepID=UPI002E0F24D4|nr:hypothetical protein OG294_27805 [Kitasatospora sp. NBC_01302]
MPLLARLADKFCDRYADRIDTWVRETVSAIPSSEAERHMRTLHDVWASTAQLHRSYFDPEASFFWAGDGVHSDVRLACVGEYVFVRRDRTGLYTAGGTHSWDAFYRAGVKGLTTDEPPKPPKTQEFTITGELGDAEHPERWEITLH